MHAATTIGIGCAIISAMDQQIRFCTTSDGVRIAYATVGEGPPLVKASNWLTHLEFDWESPVWRHLFGALAENHTLIRYDQRGTGLSDRKIEEASLEGWVRDLEAVAEAVKFEEFALLGISQGGPAAIQYSIRHPERVTHLVLYGSFAHYHYPAYEEMRLPLLSLVRDGWGGDNPAFRQVFTSLFIPDAGTEHMRWFNELERLSTSPEMAAKILEEQWGIDIRDVLPSLKVPTLVIHRRGDAAVPFDMGREMAGLIPNARFIPVEGNNHYILEEEDEFEVFLDAIEQFLGQDAVRRRKAAAGPLTILFTDIEESTRLTQRLGDAEAQELVRVHNAIVRVALRTNGGSEIKHTGDGIMASFRSASGALESAIAIQKEVAAYEDERLSVRVGLNAGEPLAEDADLFGTAVQLASRVCGHAAGGQILVPDVIRQLTAGKGFLFSQTGEVALKGFEDPVRLYEVRWRDG